MNGNWQIKIQGYGKIRPHDADAIEELFADFITTLKSADHEIRSGTVRKSFGEEPEEP